MYGKSVLTYYCLHASAGCTDNLRIMPDMVCWGRPDSQRKLACVHEVAAVCFLGGEVCQCYHCPYRQHAAQPYPYVPSAGCAGCFGLGHCMAYSQRRGWEGTVWVAAVELAQLHCTQHLPLFLTQSDAPAGGGHFSSPAWGCCRQAARQGSITALFTLCGAGQDGVGAGGLSSL